MSIVELKRQAQGNNTVPVSKTEVNYPGLGE